MKIFTKDDRIELDGLVLDAIYEGMQFPTTLGNTVTVYDLFHSMNIASLRIMLNRLKQRYNTLVTDDWVEEVPELTNVNKMIKLVYLVIGYRVTQEKVLQKEREIAKLRMDLENAIDSAKTPEDKIQEIRSQIESLERE